MNCRLELITVAGKADPKLTFELDHSVGADHLKLLAIDSIINVVLGSCLLFIPGATIRFFGLPPTDTNFYVTVLGAVLLGIGIALWIERHNEERWRGLGLGGAVIINTLGAGTVLVWLILDPFNMPLHGYLVLWSVALIVLGTGLIELAAIFRRSTRSSNSRNVS